MHPKCPLEAAPSWSPWVGAEPVGIVRVVVPAKACENGLAERPDKTVATVLPTTGLPTTVVEAEGEATTDMAAIIFFDSPRKEMPDKSKPDPREAGDALYATGRKHHESKNYDQAMKWLQKAAEQGHAGARLQVATLRANGQGVAKNLTEAVTWYRMAAARGLARAQIELGYLLDIGRV